MTDISTSWNGTLILTSDFNIDLLILNSCKESTKRYKDILHMLSLQQHVTKPTRKSKTLIDHIFRGFRIFELENRLTKP